MHFFVLFVLFIVFTTSTVRACVRCLPGLSAALSRPPALIPLRLSLSESDFPQGTETDVEAYLRSVGFETGKRTPPEDNGDDEDEAKEPNPKLKEAMLGAINWYRSTLSPLMPKNCRFLPTCSQYGLDSISKYGSVKGGVLTAWRVLRCNPLGGSGYDAPVWPPPSYFAGSNTFPRKKKTRNPLSEDE
jgi:putative membrane protein insertion efficiency factor